MKEFTLKSRHDDLDIAVAVVAPDGNPKGILQVVHGMVEHKNRYYPFMEWMASKGYVCVAHDHRGHGSSIKSREDLGFMYEGGWQALIDDTLMVNEWVRSEYPGLPLTLLGHSMGSMVVRAFTKRYDDRIDALIVVGCPSNNPAKGFGICLARILGFFCGSHHRSKLMYTLSIGSYNKAFKAENDRNAWIVSDLETRASIAADDHCGFIFTANGYYNLLSLMKDCYDTREWALANPSLPVRFLSGAEDPCRVSDEAIAKAVEAMKKAGYADVTLKLYPGMRHHILLETDRVKVWNDILALVK